MGMRIAAAGGGGGVHGNIRRGDVLASPCKPGLSLCVALALCVDCVSFWPCVSRCWVGGLFIEAVNLQAAEMAARQLRTAAVLWDRSRLDPAPHREIKNAVIRRGPCGISGLKRDISNAIFTAPNGFVSNTLKGWHAHQQHDGAASNPHGVGLRRVGARRGVPPWAAIRGPRAVRATRRAALISIIIR